MNRPLKRWLLLFTGFVCACTFFLVQAKRLHPPAKMGQRSFKGWELYSWKSADSAQADDWHFNLLAGTNRRKSLDEAQNSEGEVIGLDALTERLSQLAPGQTVSWADQLGIQPQGQLSYPPREQRENVKQFAKQHKLEFYTLN